MSKEAKLGILKEPSEWMLIAEILMIASDELDLRNGKNSVLAMKVSEIAEEIKRIVKIDENNL